MNVKIQSRGIAGGKNTGSCSGYVNYLEHENKEKEEAGMADQQIPFFDSDGSPVTKAEVIESLDLNVSQLHRDDAKFYSVIISFSDEEVEAMGQSREEVLANAHVVVEKAMDLYARNFDCDRVSSHSDIKYYYIMHECRGESEPGLHIHIAVSRKDATSTYKLSPMTNHRGGNSGVIKRGFNRDAFYRSCEQMFDKSFAFDRSLDRSYDYYNTMKHGSLEQRESMIREVVKQSQLIQQINDPLRHLPPIPQGSQIRRSQIPVSIVNRHIPYPLGKGSKLCNRQHVSVRISQAAANEQEARLSPGQRNLLLGGAGVLTTSSVRLPSFPSNMGFIQN